MRLALESYPGVHLASVGIDLTFPRHRRMALRILDRIGRSEQLAELRSEVWDMCLDFPPDVIIIFKGWHFDADFIRTLRTTIAPVVNIFPDASPHAHGERMKKAIGEYSLVISRKKFHPPNWKNLYGYSNPCIHLPHGYSSPLHYRDEPPVDCPYDVVMVATGRSEYELLIRGLYERLGNRVRMAVCGGGWQGRKLENLPGLTLCGPKSGIVYVEWLRKGTIVIAPVQTTLQIGDQLQLGDEVSARTFECAAAYTFFIHRRTEEVKQYYDEETEVPMYDAAGELGDKILYFLGRPDLRRAMATAAHARAVPNYSIEYQVPALVRLLGRLLSGEEDIANTLHNDIAK
jgi:glycosyltransferase involved in cell wall biosynthesis